MPIKVLIVDDSIVVRKLITTALSAVGGIEIVGSASNGVIALEQARKLKPDAITLDIEMPEMDGLTALPLLKDAMPGVPIIMFSTLTEHGAAATLKALELGAIDYVTKPANVGSVQESLQVLQDELATKIKALFDTKELAHDGDHGEIAGIKDVPKSFPKGALAPSSIPGRIDAVVIAVSTGGPTALGALLPELPADLAAPVLIVQHMPPTFTRVLAERLDSKSQISVIEGQAGTPLKPGHAVIAPGDFHMVIQQGGYGPIVGLNQNEKENSCRPAADVLFRSAADVFGGNVLSVVLTGMGQDGLAGVNSLRSLGSYVITQDHETSVVWGMPGAVARADLADEILPIDQIAGRIKALVGTTKSIGDEEIKPDANK